MRTLLKLIVVIVVIVAAAAFFLGWHMTRSAAPASAPSTSVGTSGQVDTQKARQIGASVGEKTAEAANKAAEVLSDSALTAKIKSKMALDDQVKARSIDVSTTNGVVTLTGTVRSAAEHDKAVQLAKETTGVVKVNDKLTAGSD